MPCHGALPGDAIPRNRHAAAWLAGALCLTALHCSAGANPPFDNTGTMPGNPSSSGGDGVLAPEAGAAGGGTSGSGAPGGGSSGVGAGSSTSSSSSGAASGGGPTGSAGSGSGSGGAVPGGGPVDGDRPSSSGGTPARNDGGVAGTAASQPKIPTAASACPDLATGNVTVLGQSVQIFAGTRKTEQQGPVFFYWHGTGSTSAEVQTFMSSQIQEITAAGGLVASFTTTTKTGTNTGNDVWFTGDFAMADEILACAVQQLNIDVRRVYTGGCSAGGLQAGAMVYARSGYLAAAMPNSGGIIQLPGLTTFDDPSHVPALITTHGAPGTDVVVIDFSQSSMTEDKDIVSKGGFAVDCNHGGGHCQAPAADIAGQWQFLKDHPFGVSPEPYANGLPSTLPSYCTIVQ